MQNAARACLLAGWFGTAAANLYDETISGDASDASAPFALGLLPSDQTSSMFITLDDTDNYQIGIRTAPAAVPPPASLIRLIAVFAGFGTLRREAR